MQQLTLSRVRGGAEWVDAAVPKVRVERIFRMLLFVVALSNRSSTARIGIAASSSSSSSSSRSSGGSCSSGSGSCSGSCSGS